MAIPLVPLGNPDVLLFNPAPPPAEGYADGIGAKWLLPMPPICCECMYDGDHCRAFKSCSFVESAASKLFTATMTSFTRTPAAYAVFEDKPDFVDFEEEAEDRLDCLLSCPGGPAGVCVCGIQHSINAGENDNVRSSRHHTTKEITQNEL